MKKSALVMFLFIMVLSADLNAQDTAIDGMFSLSADFSIAFGSVESDYTEAPLNITGYGIGESMNVQTAMARARAQAYEQLGQQAAGVDFKYSKTDASVTLVFYFTEKVSGAQVLSSTVLPPEGAVSRVFVVAGVEMPVVVPKDSGLFEVSVKGSGDDIDAVMSAMMKDAVKQAVAGTARGGKAVSGTEVRGILYLSNLVLIKGGI